MQPTKIQIAKTPHEAYPFSPTHPPTQDNHDLPGIDPKTSVARGPPSLRIWREGTANLTVAMMAGAGGCPSLGPVSQRVPHGASSFGIETDSVEDDLWAGASNLRQRRRCGILFIGVLCHVMQPLFTEACLTWVTHACGAPHSSGVPVQTTVGMPVEARHFSALAPHEIGGSVLST